MLSNSTSARHGDIDAILENIQPPMDLLAMLKPEASCTVANFLSIRAPPRPGSRKYFLEASSWFSSEPPNNRLDDVDDLILPSEKLCETLDGHLRKAVERGMCSVEHPVKSGVFLPLCAVRAWKWGNVLVKKQKMWRTRLDWVKETAAEEGWPYTLQEKVTATVMSTPWHMGYRALQNGTVSTTTLALLLSDEWLNDERIDCIGDIIRADMLTHGVPSSTQVPSCLLAKNMEMPGEGSTETMWGERLRSGAANKLDIQYNVKNIHWILVEIDVTNRTLNIGDSMPQVTDKALPVVPNIQSILTTWLKYYLPEASWHTNLRGMTIPLQLDKNSCGIASSSAIHHHLVPTAPLWDPKKPGKSRAYYFCRCVELGKGVSMIVMQLNGAMTLAFLQVITGIRDFWDDNGKGEVGSVPVGPSTTADPKLMVDLVLLSDDDSSHDQSNQDRDEMHSSHSDSDSEDLS
jgi:hypothetical protein